MHKKDNAHEAAREPYPFRHNDYGQCRHNIKALDRSKALQEWVKE